MANHLALTTNCLWQPWLWLYH